MELRPLSPALGVEVLGLEARHVSAETGAALVEASREHGLLLWRDQELEPTEQLELMRSWGEPLMENPRRRQSWVYVSNARSDGILEEGAYAFHLDHAFMPDPIEALSMFALEVPGARGTTRFAHAGRACESLPSELRERVEGRSARHVIDPSADPGDIRIELGRLDDSYPHAVHPILCPHPETGRETLFVTAQQTDRIEGLPEAESDALVRALCAHLYDPAHVYEHTWREGDLVVWDNRILQHARPDHWRKSDEPRTLRRISVGGSPVWRYFKDSTGLMHIQESSP